MLLSPLTAQEGETPGTYVLAREGAPLPAGKTFANKRAISMTDAKMALEAGEQVVQGVMSTLEEEERLIEFVDQTKVRISVTKQNKQMAMQVGQAPVRKRGRVKATEGKVFLVEKVDGKWSAKVEKGEVTKEQEEEIQRELKSLETKFSENYDTEIYGTEPRKIGESWKVAARFVPLAAGLDIKEGECTLEFKEVKTIDGEDFAVLKMVYDIKAVSDEVDQKGMSLHFTGTGETLRSLSLLMDYQFDGESKVEIDGMLPIQQGKEIAMKVSGVSRITSRTGEVKEGE